MQNYLSVTVSSGWNLIAKDINGKSDPYFLIGWLHDGGFEGKPSRSSTQQKTLSPFWWREAGFEAKDFDAAHNKVLIQIWDEDTIGKDEFMGEVIVDLGQIDMTAGTGTIKTNLGSRPNKKDKVSGEITIEYTYYTAEWKTSTNQKLTEDMTKQEEGHPPFSIDQETLVKVVDAVMRQTGDIDTPDKLNSVLSEAGVLEKVIKSDFIPLEIKSYDSDAQVKVDRDTRTKKDEIVFALFDANGDKKISAREIAIGIAMHSAATNKEKAALYFDLFDKNKDGKLVPSEMAVIFKSIIDLWICALALKAEAEMSYSIDFNLRWKASEDIRKIETSLKSLGLENTLSSNMFRVAKKADPGFLTRDEFMEMMDDFSIRRLIGQAKDNIEAKLNAPAEMAMNVALSKARLNAMGIRF